MNVGVPGLDQRPCRRGLSGRGFVEMSVAGSVEGVDSWSGGSSVSGTRGSPVVEGL